MLWQFFFVGPHIDTNERIDDNSCELQQLCLCQKSLPWTRNLQQCEEIVWIHEHMDPWIKKSPKVGISTWEQSHRCPPSPSNTEMVVYMKKWNLFCKNKTISLIYVEEYIWNAQLCKQIFTHFTIYQNLVREVKLNNNTKSAYLIHSSSQNHKVCIKELQVLIAIMHPSGVGGYCRKDVTDEGMALVHDGIDKTPNHPAVQSNLRYVVQNHGFLQKNLHVNIGQELFCKGRQKWEAHYVSHR